MKLRRSILRSLAVASSVGLLTLGAAGPAAAENVGKALVVGNEWKAYGLYDDGANLLCVRAYNSVNSARAYVWITFAGGQTYPFADDGGDDNRACRDASLLDGRGPGTMYIQHIGSGGAVNTTTASIGSL